jgi:hypothetical protein
MAERQVFRVWKTGERCRVRLGRERRIVPAVVQLASGNGHSLFIVFEAMLGGHAGAAPLLWDESRGGFYSIASEALFELFEP